MDLDQPEIAYRKRSQAMVEIVNQQLGIFVGMTAFGRHKSWLAQPSLLSFLAADWHGYSAKTTEGVCQGLLEAL